MSIKAFERKGRKGNAKNAKNIHFENEFFATFAFGIFVLE